MLEPINIHDTKRNLYKTNPLLYNIPIKHIKKNYPYCSSSSASITIFSPDQARVLTSLRREATIPTIRNGNVKGIRGLDWFQKLLSSDRDTVYLDTRKAAFVSMGASEPMFAIVKTIRSPYNYEKIIGTLLLEIPSENLRKALAGFKLGNNGGYEIINSQGAIIYTADEKRIEAPYKGVMPGLIEGGSNLLSCL